MNLQPNMRPSKPRRRILGPKDLLQERLDDLEVLVSELRGVVQRSKARPKLLGCTARWTLEHVRRTLCELTDLLEGR